MALGLYKIPDDSKQFNTLEPFTVTFDGRVGGAQDRLIYLRNNDATRWYSNMQVSVIDIQGLNLVNESIDGFFWKLLSKDIPPTEEEWGVVTPGNTLSISPNIGSATIGDIITFIPIWVRVKIPRGQIVSVITDITLRVTATEGAV